MRWDGSPPALRIIRSICSDRVIMLHTLCVDSVIILCAAFHLEHKAGGVNGALENVVFANGRKDGYNYAALVARK